MSSGLFANAPYVVESESQRGNYVHLICTEQSSGRRVKVTALHEHVLNNDEAQQEFEQLARLQKRISHKSVAGVVAFHAAGEVGDRAYLVTETLRSTLADVLLGEKLEPATAQTLVLNMAAGLNAIHAAGVLHLDLNPANVLYDPQVQLIKISNFESACEIGVQITSIAMDPKYSAPEKYHSEQQINEQADIYSLGMMALELALGAELFEKVFADIHGAGDDNLQKQRWLHWHMDANASVKPLSELTIGHSEAFSSAVDKMLRKNLSERYVDVSGIINDLGGLSSGGDTPLVQPLDPNAIATKKTSGWLMAVYLMLGVAVLGGGGYYGYDYYLKQQLNAELRAELSDELARTTQKRAEAVEKGADSNIALFVSTEETFSKAKAQFNAGQLALAIDSLRAAYEGYVEVIAGLQSDEVGKARDAYAAALREANTLQVSRSYVGYELAEKYAETAEAFAISESTQSAVEQFQLATDELKQAINQGSREFYKGSSTEGIDAALRLCQQFQTRCDRSWYSDEAGSQVDVDPFWIAVQEVTVDDFRQFVEATDYETTAQKTGFSYLILGDSSARSAGSYWDAVTGLNTPHYSSGRAAVLHVSVADAEAYCQWRGQRLPTEAEWEYAASGATSRLFAWGAEWDDTKPSGFVPDSEDRLLAAVDTYGVTPEGLQGVTGGVWEWTATRDESGAHISKGGAWSDVNPAHLRIQARRAENTRYTSNDIGFRCAKSATTWESLYRSEP